MPAKLEELALIFQRERQRWDKTIIGEALPAKPIATGETSSLLPPETFTIKGDCEPDDLRPQLTYRFYGRWELHPKHGKQFHFQTFVRSQPHGRAGIIRYLDKAPNIGHERAKTLWEKFGADAVRILRESPDVAAAAVRGGLTTERAQEAATYLRGEIALESCTIDLIEILGGRGFPRGIPKLATAKWGNKAADFIRRSPYLLLPFRGVGFLRCDAMFLNLGGDPNCLKRQAYCAAYSIASNTDGHTWFSSDHLLRGLKDRIAGTEIRPADALMLAIRGGLLETKRDERGKLWVAELKKAKAEKYVAEAVAAALAESMDAGMDSIEDGSESSGTTPGWQTDWPGASWLEGVAPHQAERIAAATAGLVGILTGSPGTGKTFSAAALITAIVGQHGEESVAVAAPTGKAAVRITEALAGYGLSVKARTIHSLLKVAQKEEGEGWGFEHGEGNPLPQKFIIVDEFSMADTSLLASLLAARATGTHILFVGDPNQLAPVGHGAPLRDLIAAGVPCGELTEIQRNSGTIVRACAEIRDGRPFKTDEAIDLQTVPNKNLRIIPASGPADQLAKMLAVIAAAAKNLGLDPVWDVQVLVAVNKKSPLARKEVNAVLQRELNKSGQGTVTGSCPFRVGDKIVNLKNGFFPIDDDRSPPGVETNPDGKVFVANGELAAVLEVQEKLTVARLTSPDRVIKIPRGNGSAGDGQGDDSSNDDEKTNTGCSWDLGYALSVHKSQGSEWPMVVVLIDDYPGARMVCSREHCYTSISRAKRVCLMIGKRATLDGFCRRQALHNRKTFLKEELLDAITKTQTELASHAHASA